MKLEKFHGIIPAFYACYDDQGDISEARTQALCDYLYEKRSRGSMSEEAPASVFTKAWTNVRRYLAM